MTQSEQESLLHRLLCQPETLTDEEMTAALSDPDVRELYEAAAHLRSAALREQTYNINKEWEAFRISLPLSTSTSPSPSRSPSTSRSMSTSKSTSTPSWWRSRAAAIILVLSLGAAAATLTFTVRALGSKQSATEQRSDTIVAVTPSHRSATQVPVMKETRPLSTDLTFENLPLADIARQVADSLACDIVFADKETPALRLYLTLESGCTVADFVAIIDSYSTLAATLHQGVVTIKKKEAKR